MRKTKDGTVAKEGPPKITGVAFTIEASEDSGFSNFRIITLFMVDGEIVHRERSQGYAAFEALAKTEVMLNAAIWNLRNRFKNGDYQSLGGDQRDELLTRLKKHSPEILEKIRPALYLKADA